MVSCSRSFGSESRFYNSIVVRNWKRHFSLLLVSEGVLCGHNLNSIFNLEIALSCLEFISNRVICKKAKELWSIFNL